MRLEKNKICLVGFIFIDRHLGFIHCMYIVRLSHLQYNKNSCHRRLIAGKPEGNTKNYHSYGSQVIIIIKIFTFLD